MLSFLLLLRFVIGALLAVVLPGAMTVLLLFGRARFDGAERAFLVLSSSIAISSLVAVALAWSPGGLQAWSFTLAILVLSTLLGLGAAVRHGGRRHLRATLGEAAQWLGRWPRTLRWRSAELPLFLIALIVLVGIGLGRGESSTRVTEFYFPPEQLPVLLNQSAQPQTPLEVPLEIANGAAQAASFRIEVWSGDAKISERGDITVEAQGIGQTTVAVPAAATSEEHALEFRLFDMAQRDPVARLRLQRGAPRTDNAARQ